MFETVFGGSALNCLFGAALLIGFLYALFLLFFQGVGHAFDISDIEIFGHDIDLGSLFDFGHDIDVSHDLDIGHHDAEVSGLSMLAISGFITAFGGFGLASASLLKAGPVISLLAAIVGGILVGGAAQIFFIQVLSPTASSNVNLQTLKGKQAEITVPITAAGMGQIAANIGGQRMTLRARSSGGIDIQRRTLVVIDSIRDGVAYVSLANNGSHDLA